VVEFYGGGVKWFVQRLPGGQFTLALTLGHTILGQTDAALNISRNHEMVHVRQYERWGPLMGPAYLGCSLVLWLMRRKPYGVIMARRPCAGESTTAPGWTMVTKEQEKYNGTTNGYN
jgi:hypothetical protein